MPGETRKNFIEMTGFRSHSSSFFEDRSLHIAVEGVMDMGKSSLVRLLSARWGGQSYFGDVEDHLSGTRQPSLQQLNNETKHASI